MVAKRKALCWPLLLMLALSLTGCFGQKKAEDVKPARSASIGVVDMDKAVRSHPKYKELAQVQKESNTLLAQAQAQRAQSALLPPGMEPPSIDIRALSAPIEQQANEKLAAKHAEISKRLNEKAEAVRGQLTAQLKEYADETDKKFNRDIFNVKLKLLTLQLTRETHDALQARLQELQKERDAKIAAREKELLQQMDQRLAPEQEAAEKEMAAYQRALQLEVNKAVAAKQRAIMAAAKARQEQLMNEAKLKITASEDAEKHLTYKRQEAGALEEAIVKDIRAGAAKAAAKRRLDVVVTNVKVNVNAIDLTDEIIAGLK